MTIFGRALYISVILFAICDLDWNFAVNYWMCVHYCVECIDLSVRVNATLSSVCM